MTNIHKLFVGVNGKILNIILLFVFIYLLKAFTPFLNVPTQILNSNIGENATTSVIGWGLLLFLFFTVLYTCIVLIYALFDKEPNDWIFGTVLAMFFVFVIGMVFIQDEVGNKNSVLLLDCNSTYKEDCVISCKSLEKPALVIGSQIFCNIPTIFSNQTTEITLHQKGERKYAAYQNRTNFIAPPDVTSVIFEINGQNKMNKSVNVTVGKYHEFISESDFEKTRKDFLNYLLALLAVIAFSIPSAASNFKSLCEKKREKTNNKE